MKSLAKIPMWAQIIGGIIIGIGIGFISPAAAKFLSPLGTVFLNLLKMLIVPLVFFSITNGICKMSDAKQLRTVGGRIVLYYLLSSAAAAVAGVVAGLLVKPGSNVTDFAKLANGAGKAVKFSFSGVVNDGSKRTLQGNWMENMVKTITESRENRSKMQKKK